jgi:glycosyltransferase involved in cell wall biosynthesis
MRDAISRRLLGSHMRVLHYRQTFSKLSETFVYDYVTELQRQGVMNHVVTHDHRNEEARPFENVTEVDWPTRWRPDRLSHVLYTRLGIGSVEADAWPIRRRRLTSVVRRVRPDVIHAHFGNDGVVIAPVAAQLSIPLVVTFYGFDISSLPKKSFWTEAYNTLWDQVAAVTVLSKEMKRRVERLGCPEEKVHIVHLSRRIDQFPYCTPRRQVRKILFVGRLTAKKAPLDAVRALERANNRGADLELDILGDGERRKLVERYIAKHDLSDTVTLHGRVDNEKVVDYMRDADAFLLPSKTAPDGDREGTPTVLVEAQCIGLPCVSTRHAGIPEMIPESNHHLLSDEGDISGLSESLYYLSELDVEFLRKISRYGREMMEKSFNLVREVEDLVCVYNYVTEDNK